MVASDGSTDYVPLQLTAYLWSITATGCWPAQWASKQGVILLTNQAQLLLTTQAEVLLPRCSGCCGSGGRVHGADEGHISILHTCTVSSHLASSLHLSDNQTRLPQVRSSSVVSVWPGGRVAFTIASTAVQQQQQTLQMGCSQPRPPRYSNVLHLWLCCLLHETECVRKA